MTQAYRPVDLFLSRLEKVIQTGPNRYKACCPAHDDINPSMTVKCGDKGQVVFHCFAGCSPQEIVESAGLKFGDLYVTDDYTPPKKDLSLEYTVLKITASQINQGEDLDPLDRNRALLAMKRIIENE